MARPSEVSTLSAAFAAPTAKSLLAARGSRAISLQIHTGGSARRNTTAILEEHDASPWLAACVDLIADALADALVWTAAKSADERTTAIIKSAPREVRRKALGGGRVVGLPDHELLALLGNPGDGITGRALARLMAQHLLLVGETFLLLRRNESGKLIGLTIIPPSAVAAIPTLGHDKFTVNYESLSGDYPTDSVVWLKTPSPLKPHGRGVGVAHHLSTEISALDAMSRTIQSIYQRGGLPAAIIAIDTRGPDGSDDDEELLADITKQLDQRFAGPSNAGRAWVVSGKVSGSTVGADLKVLDTANLAQALRDQVRQTFRVPAELLGNISAATRAQLDASRAFLHQYAVQPLLELLRSELQAKLAPRVDAGVALDYLDLSPDQQDLQAQLMSNPTTAPAFTVGEVRRLAGMPDAPLEGEERMLPMPGSKPVGEL